MTRHCSYFKTKINKKDNKQVKDKVTERVKSNHKKVKIHTL